MTRVRTRWHFSRLLLLFSSSGALQAHHYLTLLLLGLTSLHTTLTCDEKTRPQSRDLSTLPRYLEIQRHSKWIDLGVTGVIPEWMQRENEALSMAGQSASDVANNDHPSDSLKTQWNHDGFDPLITKRAYFNDDIFASRVNDRVYSKYANYYSKRKSDDRLSNPAKTRQVRNGSNFQSMKQREESAKKWLSNLIKKRHDVPKLQVTPYYLVNQAVNKVHFRDSDNEASVTILNGPRRSASNLPESSVHDRDAEEALIDVPIDQLDSREAPSVSYPTRNRRDRNEVSFKAERANLNGDNLFETPVNYANKRTSNYSAHRSSRRSEVSSRLSKSDIDEHHDNLASDRSGIVGFWTARQTHLNRRNIHALDNRSDGARKFGSQADRLYKSDDIVINDVRNEFTNANTNDSVNAIAIDAVADDFDIGTISIENQNPIELNGISEIENRTDVNSEYVDSFLDLSAEISPANCRNVACSKSSGGDVSMIKIKKFGETTESQEDQEYEDEDHFQRVGEITAMPGNDSNTDIDSEAPFTGFEGSQKFPVKINHKSPPMPPQVEKFDRRHFGPHKEDVVFEETSTWSPSILLPDLPKSPSKNVLHRKTNDHISNDDVNEMDKTDNRSEETTEMDEKRNNTYDESWLPGTEISGGHLSGFSDVGNSDEKFAVTSNIADSEFENATRDRNDSDSRTKIDVTIPSVRPIEKINITILGLFEMTHRAVPRLEGSSELQAAKLAVERVNELDILKRFRLRLIYNDTKCDSGVAVDRFFHALYSTRKKHLMPFLLGTACSEVTETLAKIVPYWNVIQVSFGSTAPALSDSNEFPLFLRTVAPDSSHNPARIALIKHFGWDTVTALSQTGDMYSLAVNDLVTELEQANITCTATITFAENDYKEQLRTLKELDTRIIIGSFSPQLAQRVFCEAWKLGMHGGDYAWILPGETIDSLGITGNWWKVGGECSPSQLSQTLDGLIIVKSHATVVGNETSVSGLTSKKFTSELNNTGVVHSKFASQTYDAVWAMALALAKTEVLLNRRNESMAQYAHTRKDLTKLLLKQLKDLRFIGVSGPVSFDDADRVGITAFYQMHGHDIKRIAIYTPEDEKLIMNCPGCEATRWPEGQVPAARRVFRSRTAGRVIEFVLVRRLRMVTVAPAAFLAITCIASVGVTLALAFLAFNLHFRKHKSIKLSSPRLNNMAAVGCGLVYGAVILLGLDDATLPDSDGYYPTVCKARVYLLSAGFSLAFGSMFTKTYRVHRIFTRSRSGVVKNKLLQDTQLIFLICMLLVIDVVVVTLWVILDPMQRHLQNLTLEISPQDRGVVYQPQVEVCRSQHTNGWLSALYVYKGLLLVVGVYMAWETRHVKIPALNDSQYIGMSVYFVVITSGIVVVLANLMSDRATLAFVTITALILASTTATLTLLFLPQLANILAGERADPVVQSLGLKIECNTRRFVTDDRRELQYRVEVQNRVYRREMAQLELELARLEKQLAQEPVEPSHTSSSASIPQRNPSIGGGLPLLLLSVLPPVIPRASWPSADSSGIRRGTVAFSSQPDLEPDDPRQSLADLYKLHRRRETEGPNRLGVFQRLFSLFGSRPSSRKTSTASFTGVASALRVHMGYIAGLVPGAKAASTCQVDAQGTHSPHTRCGSGPIISITSEEDRRLSLVGLRRKESSEPKVNFSLPPQTSTSQSSSREKIRGSPRFPHRIIPANSLSAIAQGTSVTRPHRWHSMDDATKPKVTQTTTRGSCSPNSDVWTASEIKVSFSEANTVRVKKPPDSLVLTIPVDSKMSPIDTRLGSDLRKLFRENDSEEAVSPAEHELKTMQSSSSSSSSMKIIGDSASLKNDSTPETRHDIVPNFRQESKPRPTSPVISIIDMDNPEEESNTDVDSNVSTSCEEKRSTPVT
ncbi:Gamma-aminobutyric acid type B receptor subunit 2 [Atta colombica]|uniref:Gamma-aminobutyric acid type B receptor subunit 2 n=1 Tax=Atta colombica TaxID=520822 RepID=A0A195BUN8_9HYME|nr:Gamma-aminobutyric acid type B receptor subunit 2 [Atta colombica]